MALLFELLAERFGPGRHEFSNLEMRQDRPAADAAANATGPNAPLRLNLRGVRYGEAGQAHAGPGEGVDLPRGRIIPAAILRGSPEEETLWRTETELRADLEARAAEETALLWRALGPGATYRGAWRRAGGHAADPATTATAATSVTLEFTVESFEAGSGAMRARLRRADPGPPGPLTAIMEGEVEVEQVLATVARQSIATREAARAVGGPVRLFDLYGRVRGEPRARVNAEPLRSTPLGDEYPSLEFTLVDRGPAGVGAGTGAARFVLRSEEPGRHVFEAEQVAPGAVSTAAPAPTPASSPGALR